MSPLRLRYQTVEFGEMDVHIRTLRDTREFQDDDGRAAALGISSASWSLFGVIWASGQALARHMVDYEVSERRILELGCGHGRDAAWFEAHGLEVVAADLSAGMLAETRRRVAGPIVQLDMCALALRDGIFDGVWCDAAMLHLPKAFAPVALCEVRRVLKPRGIVFVSIQVGDAEVWETGAYDGPGARFFARYAPAEVGALIENAGFQLIEDHESYGGPRRKWAHYFASRE